MARMVTSGQVGCSWCIDFGYWEHHAALGLTSQGFKEYCEL